MKFFSLFGMAFQFMTALPIKKNFNVTSKDLASISFFFPVTGLFVGFVSALLYYFVSWAGMGFFASVCAAICGCVLTGGLHFDGFADMCDAFGARKDAARTLEILKDSRVGTFGVLGIVTDFALRVALYWTLSSDVQLACMVILVTPSLSKTAMVMCGRLGKYPRADGTGKHFVNNINTLHVVVTAAVAGAVAFFFMGLFFAVVAVCSMIALGVIMTAVSSHKIGGVTGDILGASNEIGEIAILIIYVLTEVVR